VVDVAASAAKTFSSQEHAYCLIAEPPPLHPKDDALRMEPWRRGAMIHGPRLRDFSSA
jgi:hypothetical protein